MTRLGDALYRLVLLAFPASFRRRHGQAMVVHFRAQRRAVRGRPMAHGALWARGALDAMRHGLAARLDARTGSRSPRRPSRLDRLAFGDALSQDLLDGLRSLARGRAYVGLSVLCLGLALGVNLTAFVFVNGILLRPLPLDSPDGLVTLHEVQRDVPGSDGPVSYRTYLDWKDRAGAGIEIAAARRDSFKVSDGVDTRRYAGALVSWDFFFVVGVRPAIGRGFLEPHDRAGASPVVVLSHSLWEERYGRDPRVIGRTITIDGTVRTVIGVMPEGLLHPGIPSFLRAARLWIPIGPVDAGRPRTDRQLVVVARLGADDTLDAVRARFDVVAWSLSAAYTGQDGWGVSVQPVRLTPSAMTRAMLWLGMGAVTAVLLVACANVANLSLARALGRRREFATRAALGASHRRLARQLLSESLLIAVPAVPIGLVLAYWGRGLLLGRSAGPELYVLTAFDPRVFVYGGALALLAGVACGVLPALRVLRGVRDRGVLLVSGRGAGLEPGHTRLGSTLAVGQVAMSVVLLAGASLFGQSFQNLLHAEGGFDTSRILNLRIALDEEAAEVAPDAGIRQLEEVVYRLRSLPGVTHAAAANLLPLRNGGDRTAVLRDAPAGDAGAAPVVLLGGVTGQFFEVFDVPIVRGRALTDADVRSRAPVAVVNETMARRLWPDEEAIGRRFRMAAEDHGRWFTVVGVSEGILTWDVSNRVLPAAYLPYSHLPVREPGLFVRTSGEPVLLAPAARAAVHDVDAALPVLGVQTMTDVHYGALSRNRTLAWVLAAVSGMALALGALGVYGVLANRVSQQAHEIGIRAALGADRGRLIRLFVGQGMVLTMAGVAIGVPSALGLARVVRGRLYEVSAADPLTFGAVALLLAATGLLATHLPARRAAAVDPLRVIRE